MRISSNSGLLFFALLSVFFVLFSCERKEPLNNGAFDCAECYRDKPVWGPLNVVLTINQENQYVPITIYIGNIEDTIVDYVDTAYLKDYWVDVEPDRYYSVKAEYKQGDKTIYAVDGDKLNIKYSSNDCDEPCYYFQGGNIDVRLRE